MLKAVANLHSDLQVDLFCARRGCTDQGLKNAAVV
jgi:hypothetical protein